MSDAFAPVLAGLYQAASGLEDWDEQWSRLVRHVGARSSVAWFGHADGRSEALATPGIEPNAFQRYLAYFQGKDPYNIDLTGTVLTSEEVIGTRAYLETEFYRDFVRTLANPTLFFMGFALPIDDGGTIRVGFQKEHGLADFDARDKQRLSPLLPHLPGMLAARSHLRLLADRSGTAQAMLDQIEDALFCVDRDARILFRNRAATALCACIRLVEHDGGGRTVLSQFRSLPLPALVRAVAAGGPARTRLLRGEDGPTHSVTVSRLEMLPDGIRHPSPRRDGALLVLVRLRALSAPSTQAGIIRSVFGLTEAEGAVAMRLCDGETIAAIAGERCVSVHTVRTQVRMILDKSGSRTLRDFVRIVARF